MQRRDFIKMGSAMAAMVPQLGVFASATKSANAGALNKEVDFIHDGLALSPKEYAELLMHMADEGKIRPDYYSNGGIVEELENKFARLLGKESAVFIPTGTLANHVAVRRLAGNNRRVIVQEQSHLYNDEGDCAQTLSGLNIIPAGENAVELSLLEVEEIVNKSKKGRVETKVGAISIETPVRRQNDRMFGMENLMAITGYARNNGIKTHLDGARIFVQAAHANADPARFGALFDTAFTSMWKCFNAASGAILAGTKAFTENLFHERRMFGGSLPGAWPFAAVAFHYADSFTEDYKKAWQGAEKFFFLLQKDDRFRVVKFENGTHIARVDVKGVDLKKYKESLGKRNIRVPAPDERGFLLKINPSFSRSTAENLAGLFVESIKG